MDIQEQIARTRDAFNHVQNFINHQHDKKIVSPYHLTHYHLFWISKNLFDAIQGLYAQNSVLGSGILLRSLFEAYVNSLYIESFRNIDKKLKIATRYLEYLPVIQKDFQDDIFVRYKDLRDTLYDNVISKHYKDEKRKFDDKYIVCDNTNSNDWSGEKMEEKVKRIDSFFLHKAVADNAAKSDPNIFQKIYFTTYKYYLSEMVHGSVVGVNFALQRDEKLSTPICANHYAMSIMNNFIIATNIWDDLSEDTKESIKGLNAFYEEVNKNLDLQLNKIASD